MKKAIVDMIEAREGPEIPARASELDKLLHSSSGRSREYDDV